jgi:hypothetical protein
MRAPLENSVPRTRQHFVRYGLAVYFASMWFSTAAVRSQNNGHYSYADGGAEFRPPFPDSYQLYGETVRVGEGCVFVDGVLHAGRFFVELKKKRTANGLVFRVGHKVVADFPAQVMLNVDLVSGVPCSRGAPPGPAIPSLDGLESLRAEAVYVRDLKRYPLEIGLASEGTDSAPWLPEVSAQRLWFLQYDLSTKGVRLTDALMITLLTKDGKKFADLSWRQ